LLLNKEADRTLLLSSLQTVPLFGWYCFTKALAQNIK